MPRSVDAIEDGALAKDTFFSRRDVREDLGTVVNEPDDALRLVFSRTSNLANCMIVSQVSSCLDCHRAI